MPATSQLAHLVELARYTPKPLRPKFGKWVRARYADHIPANPFLFPAGLSREGTELQFAAVELLARTGDRELGERAAKLLLADLRAFPGNAVFLRAALVAAVAAAPDLSARIVEELATETDPERRSAFVAALSAVEDLPRRLREQPAWISRFRDDEKLHLFTASCADRTRPDLLALARHDQHFAKAIAEVDACVAGRRKLEPTLKRWLAGTSR